ncbi:eCIS core domain-containing protein [Deinococcus sedimenti]|uniref:eCIS core domain-containing protein n=2 Tax=Deinococcus TaxID=1298 RepID=A0ABQ2S7N1_9DEIO|nr:DUF4157 domain-containing protein [Deinococcus sedimenti]GGS05643.1 hypothetical protein GCM10008960_35170 [Deinococcus sedimenti]
MTFVQRRHSKRVPGPRPVALSQVPSTAAEVQQDRIQQALYRHTVRPVTAQRQLAAPVLRAASLDRAEAARLDVQRQSAQRQLSALAVPAERPASPATRPAPARPTTPDEWVTVLRHRAEGIEGQRLDTRTFGEFQALQRQVAQHLAQGFRADRGDAQARYASYGEQLATLQRHALSAPVARVVLGMVPPVERIPLQRATDEALQRLQAQEHAALAFDTVQALQRQLAELDAEVAQPVLARIQARRGAGNPLPEAVRRHLEQGLNHDLSRVRIHDDTEADKLAKGVNAIAFTTGTDIFFRSGHFNPNTQTGLELLAHEVTHTVQQSQGRVGTGIDPDAGLEGEARAMGAKLAQVMPSPKTVLPPVPHQHGSHAPGVYTKAAALGRAQQGAVTAALHQPFQALGLQRQVMPTLQRSFLGDQISGLAGQIPGYRELCLAFGRDLVTGKTLAQNPNAILDALAKLVPGPFQDMLRAVRGQNLIPKAWAWFQGELGKLQLGQALTEVKAAVTKFPPDLGVAKSALPRRADGLKRLVSGAARHLAGIALTAIEAGLGPVGKKVMGLLRQSGDVVMQVLRDPAKFARNLLRALTQGFTQFRNNAGRWLKDGLGTWLTGASGIQFPATLDLKGVFLTALSVMGLTYHALRGRLVKELGPGGEQKVALAEKAGGALATLTKGLHQAPEVKGQQGAIGQGVVDSLKKEVTTSLMTAGAAKVASLLVPGGAFVQALLTAFSGVQTLISQGSQIMGVILNALGSVQAIAAGQVAAAAGFVERTIGGSIPIVLTFLGRLVGLGNIGTRIRNTVKKLRTRLDATIDKLIGRVRKAIGQAKTTAPATGARPASGDLIPGGVPNTDRPRMKAYHRKIARSALTEISAFPARYTTFTTFLASLKVNAQRVARNYNPYIHLPAKMTVSFQETLDTPNAIRVHIGPNDTDLYDSKNWREILEARYGKANVSSTTVANKDDRMIHMAGKRHPVTQVVYDGRGFPIFDAYSAADLHIPVAIASQKGKDKQHYEAATRELKAMIHSGKVDRSRFTAAQLQDIEKERQKITDYTWHHHQDFARMQLVKTFEHSKTGHLGGSKMWFGR